MEQEKENINARICSIFQSKMNHLFKEVLLTVDRETKSLGEGFHITHPPGQEKGFQLIRKTLLNHGNDVIRLMDLIILQLELIPKKSIIDLSKIPDVKKR